MFPIVGAIFVLLSSAFAIPTVFAPQSTCTNLGVIVYETLTTIGDATPTSICPPGFYSLRYMTTQPEFSVLLTSLCSCYSQVGLLPSISFTLSRPGEGWLTCVTGSPVLNTNYLLIRDYRAICLITTGALGSTTITDLITVTYLDISTRTFTNLQMTTTTTTSSFSVTVTTSRTTSVTVSTTITATITVDFEFTSTRTLDSRTRTPVTDTETETTNLAQTDTVTLTSTLRTSLTTTRTKTVTSVATFYSLSCPRQSTFTISTSTTASSTLTVTRCSTRTRKTTTTVVLDDPSVTKVIRSTRNVFSIDTTSTTTITTVTDACGRQFDHAEFKVCNLKNGMLLVEADVSLANAACVCKHFSRDLAVLPEGNDIYALKGLIHLDLLETCGVSKAWVKSDKCKALVKVDDGFAVLPHNCANRLPVLCAA